MPITNTSDAVQTVQDFLDIPRDRSLNIDKLRDVAEACLMAISENAIPNGTIVGFSHPTKTPSGWVDCDGTNNTPDLSAQPLRFLMKRNSKSVTVP